MSFDPVALGGIAAAGVVVAATAGIAGRLARAIAVLAPLAAAILVVQAIAPVACGAACTPAATLGPFTIWVEGVARGLTFVLRIVAMEVAAIAVLQTTHPSDLFAALARLRVPYVLNLMIALTLQLVPVLQREVGLVLAAQRARAMRGSGLSALIPSFVPVFASTVERVQQLAISLESRGFGTGPRTSTGGSGSPRSTPRSRSPGSRPGPPGSSRRSPGRRRSSCSPHRSRWRSSGSRWPSSWHPSGGWRSRSAAPDDER